MHAVAKARPSFSMLHAEKLGWAGYNINIQAGGLALLTPLLHVIQIPSIT